MLVFECPKANPRPAGEGRVRGQQLAQKSKSALGRGDDLFAVKNLFTYPPIHFKKAAFTLAEVLITLGIIGVVAAITIPGLINNYQRHIIETTLREDYSILQQMMRMSEESDTPFDVNIPDNMEGSKNWFEKYAQPYLKFGKVCYNTAGCWHDKLPTKTLAGRTAYFNQTGIGVGTDIIAVALNNGSNIIFDGYGRSSLYSYFGVSISESSTLIIFIDANGNRPPNVIGKDIYAAVYTSDGIVPAGNSMSVEDINANCSSSANSNNAGYFCLAKMKSSGWKIPDDVWKKKV